MIYRIFHKYTHGLFCFVLFCFAYAINLDVSIWFIYSSCIIHPCLTAIGSFIRKSLQLSDSKEYVHTLFITTHLLPIERADWPQLQDMFKARDTKAYIPSEADVSRLSQDMIRYLEDTRVYHQGS